MNFIYQYLSVGQRMENDEKVQVQSKITMAFAAFFLGTLGIHRWLMGYKYWWLMALCLGGFGVWSLIDLVMILQGKLKMADGRSLYP